jgi:two-component system sensor histidine kinase TctE
MLMVLLLGAGGAFALARYIGGFAYDNWLYDSALTLADQVKLSAGKVTLDLPRPAIEMFEWDRVDLIFDEAVSLRTGHVFGNAKFPRPPQAFVSGDPLFYDGTVNGYPTRIVAVLVDVPGHGAVLIQIGETMRKRDLLARKVLAVVLPLEVGVLALAGLFIWLAVTSSLRAVDHIASRLTEYDAGSLTPVDIRAAPREVMPLLESINDLLGRLSSAQDREHRFIANAAHQLRTPLATLQLQTERALREPDPVRHGDALAQVLLALKRLRRLANQLLTLAQSEQTRMPPAEMAEVDLALLTRATLESWTDAAIERRVDLGYDGPDSGIRVRGEPHLLQEMVGNLIDNAIRYGREGGQVTLGLKSVPATLTVDDDGPGIPPEERMAVLERFYRLPGALGGGCGLGLAIAREIAERHGAQLDITNTPAKLGTRVKVGFPQ